MGKFHEDINEVIPTPKQARDAERKEFIDNGIEPIRLALSVLSDADTYLRSCPGYDDSADKVLDAMNALEEALFEAEGE